MTVSRALERTIERLQDRRGRRKLGKLLLEGVKVIDVALARGFALEAVIIDEERTDLGERFPAALRVTSDHMARLASTSTPPPVLAIAAQPAAPTADRFAPTQQRSGILALDGVQNPGNLGALLRTAEACGLCGAVLGKGTVDPWSPKVLRGSMGAALALPILEVDSLTDWLSAQTAAGLQLLVAEAEGGRAPEELERRPGAPWCLLLGNEARGLQLQLGDLPRQQVTLPIGGSVGSLGVAAAGAILMYLLRD